LKAFVYAVQAGDSGPTKIGLTVNLSGRLSTLRTSCPYPLTLVYSVECGSLEEAEKIERHWHYYFGELHLRGEWFELTPEHIGWMREGHWDPALLGPWRGHPATHFDLAPCIGIPTA
jgi:hypothetical protein